MLEILGKWYERYLSEEESVLLLMLAVVSLVLLATIGDVLAPLLAAVVLAYLVQGVVNVLCKLGLPPWLGFSIAFTVFVGAFFAFLLGLLPLVWRQSLNLVAELPRMLDQGRELLVVLPERYPDFFSRTQLDQFIAAAQVELAAFGQRLVTRTLAGIPGVLPCSCIWCWCQLSSFSCSRTANRSSGGPADSCPIGGRCWIAFTMK